MKVIRKDSSVIIRPSGSLDVNTSDELKKTVLEVFSEAPKTLLVDFQEVTFLDSSGLSAMVMALKKARELNIRLSVCSIDEQAMLLFQLTGMNKVFDILQDSAAFT